ncbi:hypothetical protein PN925_000491 [Morganella morganii]|uniref:Uncharacterized protein n=2 Tax=Morganella morganii TaxID=582 RepID=A0AAI9HPD2_MORMO|nr:hypothetical protein [Morganella morganii]HCE8947771.1 hypothetical protein [Morganella morganii]
MSLFTFWQPEMLTENCQHRDDVTVLQELRELYNNDFDFSFPPGPYFGPLKTAKVVLCYANPGADAPSKNTVSKSYNRELLLQQLQGDQPYPQLPGWKQWFSPRAKNLFGDSIGAAANNIAVLNLVPYASKNMDNVSKMATCLPSAWVAQQYLRETLIPKAQRSEILLMMCRSAHLWGLRSSHGCTNILINEVRNGFTEEIKLRAHKWIAEHIQPG